MTSTTRIQLYLPTLAGIAIFLPSGLSPFLAAAFVPGSKTNFSS